MNTGTNDPATDSDVSSIGATLLFSCLFLLRYLALHTLALSPGPFVNHLLILTCEFCAWMEKQVVLQRDLAGARLRSDPGKQVDLAFAAVFLPARHIKVLTCFRHIVLDEPGCRCEVAVERPVCAL